MTIPLVGAGFQQDVIVRNAFGEFGGGVTPAFRVAINDARVAADDGEFVAKAVVGGIRGDEWQVDLLGLAAVIERGIELVDLAVAPAHVAVDLGGEDAESQIPALRLWARGSRTSMAAASNAIVCLGSSTANI